LGCATPSRSGGYDRNRRVRVECRSGLHPVLALLSSRSDNGFATNGTDYPTSDANGAASNELGLNFRMTCALSTRISDCTEFVSDRAIRTDNMLGVSLVYGL